MKTYWSAEAEMCSVTSGKADQFLAECVVGWAGICMKMLICENGAKYNNNNWKNGAKVNKIQRDIVTQYKEVFSQYDSEDKKLKLISIKEEYRSTGLLNWDGWKGNVPSHIYVLSCQRTEYRAVDGGSGYGEAVKIGDYGNKRWHKSTKIWQMEGQKVEDIVIYL